MKKVVKKLKPKKVLKKVIKQTIKKSSVVSPSMTVKALQEENEKLKKVASIRTDIVSISTHQIRTSLSALKWIIKMFLDGDVGKLTAEQESLMRKAYEGNDRAISTANELLLANKTENIIEQKYALSKIDLAELIDATIFDFSGEAHMRGIELIFLRPASKVRQANGDKEIQQFYKDNGIVVGKNAILRSQRVAIRQAILQFKMREAYNKWLLAELKNAEVTYLIRL
jgi:signal transduction histidine kinase